MCIDEILARLERILGRMAGQSPTALTTGGPFSEKAIFIWCYWDIYGGDVAKIAQALVAANFEAAYVHTNDGPFEGAYSGKINCTPALVQALKAAGLKVYGWGAPYGTNLQGELNMMVSQTARYGLAGYVIDAETTWDAHPNAAADSEWLTGEYKRLTGQPVAWCWWPFYQSSTGTPWHPKAVLQAGMKYADVGMPMAYWEGDTATQATTYLSNCIAQWRAVTSKPIVPAGRAWTGDGGSATRAAVLAYETRARDLGAVGITWWDMQHAVRLPECWQALTETKPFATGEEPEEPTMTWTDNAIGLYTTKAGWTNPAFDFIVGFAGGNWTETAPYNYVLEPNPNLKPIELQAHAEGKPFIALWDFDVSYYAEGQYMGDDAHWPPEANDYPLQRLIAALTSRDVDGLIIRVLDRLRWDNPAKVESMQYIAYAAQKFVERANRWLYQNKGLDKWCFVLTNDDFLRLDGKQEFWYAWTKNWWLGIEQQAALPLKDGAWPQDLDKIKAVPTSLGWKFWYHHNTSTLDMMIYNGPKAEMREFLGFDVAPEPEPEEPEPEPEPEPGDPDTAAALARIEASLARIEAQLAAGISMTWTGGTQ